MKNYRDIKNVVDTSKEEGIKEGKKEGMAEVVLFMAQTGKSVQEIAELTALSVPTFSDILKQ